MPSSNIIYTSPLCSCIICHEVKSSKGIHSHFITAHTKTGNDRIKETLRIGSETSSKNRILKAKIENKIKEDKYLHNPNTCIYCNNFLSYKQRNNKFCSHSCAAKVCNKERIENGYIVTIEHREKLSATIKDKTPRYTKVLQCKVCGIWFASKFNSKSCSSSCKMVLCRNAGRKGGKASNKRRVKRSKDEIKLFDLCSTMFDCESNKQLVDGWDSDIFIPKYNLAIMWNGPWHYKQMNLYNHSLEKVQSRDMLKINLFYENQISTLVFEDRYFTPESAFVKIQYYIEMVHGIGNAPILSFDPPYQDGASLLGQPCKIACNNN